MEIYIVVWGVKVVKIVLKVSFYCQCVVKVSSKCGQITVIFCCQIGYISVNLITFYTHVFMFCSCFVHYPALLTIFVCISYSFSPN